MMLESMIIATAKELEGPSALATSARHRHSTHTIASVMTTAPSLGRIGWTVRSTEGMTSAVADCQTTILTALTMVPATRMCGEVDGGDHGGTSIDAMGSLMLISLPVAGASLVGGVAAGEARMSSKNSPEPLSILAPRLGLR